MTTFSDLGLAPTILKALDHAALTVPTPIQEKAIPLALEGHDVLGLAQTGTGKTLAFGLPLIHHLLKMQGKPEPKSVKALILAPTRELANQISANLRVFTDQTHLRVNVVVGGQSINKQVNVLSRGTDILVATPGRLLDLMDRGALSLSTARHLILDEADQMLDLGFIHDLRRIAPKLGSPRQTMLFSATMPKQMEELSRAYLNDPRKVQVSPPGKAADKITQSVHFMEKTAKNIKLREILSKDMDALTLVFARTKHGAEKLMKGLVADGFDAASIHGNKSQGQRDRAIKAFRAGTIKVLVATDVAARGIDIPGVAYVINYELPEVPDNYVHRIGRTARAGLEGQAIAFCSPEEVGLLKQIERLMKISIPVEYGVHPGMDRAEKPGRKQQSRPGGGRRKGGGGRPQKSRADGGGGGKKGPKTPRPNKGHRTRRSSAA